MKGSQVDPQSMKETGEIIVHAFRTGHRMPLFQESVTPFGDFLKLQNGIVDEKTMKGDAKSHITGSVVSSTTV